MSKSGRFRSYFLRGLAVLLPTVLTIWIILWGYAFINDNISIHIKRGLAYLIKMAGGSEEELAKFWVETALSVWGFLIAVGIVCVVGAVLASVLGRTLWRQVEKFIMNTPLLKQLYPYIKQVTDFFLTPEESKKMFSRVVAVEYPRKGIWSVGLVTGKGLKKVADREKKEFLSVFISTTPSPLTGFMIIVPKDEAIDLDMSIEDAFKFIVSAGLVTPGSSQGGRLTEGQYYQKTME
ncbi:MAG: DUF502 domain-containing protein [Planctomycetota bacterium]